MTGAPSTSPTTPTGCSPTDRAGPTMPISPRPTLWKLVEARAAATPDALLVVDEHDRTMTFAEYRDACRARRGRAGRGWASARARRSRGSCRRGSSRSCWSARWRGSARCRTRSSRSAANARSGFMTRQTRAHLLLVPGKWHDFDYLAMARGVSRATTTAVRRSLVVDRDLPDGDPATLRRPLPRPTDDPVRWIFYTSGTTADPKGAQHTDATVRRERVGCRTARSTSSPTTGSVSCSRSRTSAGSPRCSACS